MKTKLILIFILMILSLQTGCLYAARYDGPYHGKVVDQQTREPIEGAVVLGTWSVYHFSLAGQYGTYYDAQEAVTDKNGEFVIPGVGLRILSSVRPMSAMIFKAGYSYYQSGFWDTMKNDYLNKDVQWEGEIPIFPLKKLTMDERKRSETFPSTPPTEASLDKVGLMLKEINIEASERGLEPIDAWRGEKIWGK